jgi:hypothetical protein
MVVQWAFDALTSILTWVLGLFPTTTLPDWSGAVTSAVATVNGYLVSISAWLPFDLVAPVLLVVAAVVVSALLIRVVRIVASFATFGGGGA